MLKLLLFAGLITAVYYVFFNKKSLSSSNREEQKSQDPMIACTKCGIYTDTNDTLTRDGHNYCSRECMEA